MIKKTERGWEQMKRKEKEKQEKEQKRKSSNDRGYDIRVNPNSHAGG